ncbi:alpha-amylase [uncultured Faecalibaculum sp.]|uniref:alpha-amylase n=1 Tax=uncultured Faecalibaculum sp. TaxID=1729681 RepID=UPI0025D310D5|nr:alpha-amylase [uncultured Faecalibaculum sp.]
MNETLIQYFEWDLEPDCRLWTQAQRQAPVLARLGVTGVWLPPAYKGQGGSRDVGYGPYDLYDLGEFRQKGSIATKYGTRKQYLSAISALQKRGIRVLADIVLNHRMGADKTETLQARTVDPSNRSRILQDLHPVTVWTDYEFPERQGKYSDFRWHWRHFTGTDCTDAHGSRSILMFEGKTWNSHVSEELGNFDYVMGADVDFSSEEVLQELYTWGKWYTETTGVNGFRLDSLKSIDSHFFPQWLAAMHATGNHPDLTLGEYWSGDVFVLKNYLNDCQRCMRLLDVPLHYHLQQAAASNGHYDIRHLFNYTLTDTDPDHAAAFVDNHDTQPGQALESWVMDWFRPQAYASILLNRSRMPVVFYGDLYGLRRGNPPVPFLREMMWIRAHLLTPNIVDLYDEDPQKACWMAWGPHPVIVLFTIADWKQQTVSEPRLAGRTLVDITDPVNTPAFDRQGQVTITCRPGGLAVYVLKEDWRKLQKAAGRFQ